MNITFPLVMLWCCTLTSGVAQSPTAHTLLYHASQPSPEADLSAVAWIAGHWQGEAFGGVTEEIWTPPLGGSMMCAFKLVVGGQVQFYEIVTLVEIEKTLLLRLKHFHGNLSGWEEKDETVDFKLVRVEPDKVFFDGFTFERISENELHVYVMIDHGTRKEETLFRYTRVRS